MLATTESGTGGKGSSRVLAFVGPQALAALAASAAMPSPSHRPLRTVIGGRGTEQAPLCSPRLAFGQSTVITLDVPDRGLALAGASSDLGATLALDTVCCGRDGAA